MTVLATIVIAMLATAPASGPVSAQAAPQQSSRTWTTPRTPWGDPDIQGILTTDDELGVPFERPEAMGEREVVTDAEFADREAQARRQAAADSEAFVRPPAAGGRGGGVGPPGHWVERGQPSRRTSLVIDPKNGRIPFLNEEARKRSLVAVNARTSGQRPYDGPEALDRYDRCITRGLPHVIFPTIYNNTSQFRRIDDGTVRYEVTVNDSTTFSRPSTAALHLKHSGVSDVFEYACHEGNYAMRNILSGAREAEKAAVGR